MDNKVSETLNNQAPEIRFNLDEFDLENYDFKPITQGLGFHHKEEKKSYKKITTSIDPSLKNRSVSKPNKEKEQLNSNLGTIKNYPQGLEAFYKNEKTPIMKPLRTIKGDKKQKEKLATKDQQFFGWFIDFSIVSASFLVLCSSFILLAGLKLNPTTLESVLGNFPYYLTGLYLMIYLFYFSLFSSGGSFGSKVCQIRLVSEFEDKKLNFSQSLIRSLTALFSLFALGLPLLFDFHGKLSQTKVINA